MAKLLFEKYDTDRNGFIDESEMKSILEDSYRQMGIPKVFTKEELDIFFEMTDADRDGKISLEEYQAVLKRTLENAGYKFVEGEDDAKLQNEAEEKVKKAAPHQKKLQDLQEHIEKALEMTKLLFKKYDTDGSGHLDKDEMKVILDSTFKEMGIEKSHSKEEVDDFFKKADANGDGYIQLLEYVDVVRDSLEKAGLSYEQFEQMAKSGNIKKN